MNDQARNRDRLLVLRRSLAACLVLGCAWPLAALAQQASPPAPPSLREAAIPVEPADDPPAPLPRNPFTFAMPASAPAGASQDSGTQMDIYGFIMLDMGFQLKQNDPDWFDVVRPTKLPSFTDEFGEDGHFYAGVRQTRFGVRTSTPTSLGDLTTIFEFELFGTGVDAGQTTLRLRHAYGELGQFGAGQTWSPFMDIDVFPNSIEYWGPNAMAFFRNVQVRWMPIKGDTRLTVALERPGASADQGVYADRIELDNISARFPLPDISAEYRHADDWGYVEGAGILRWIKWDDTLDDEFDLSGEATGWGINLSTNLHVQEHVFKGSIVFGEGVQNYMNDAPADIGIVNNFSDPVRPIEGEALPMWGLTAFMDLNWNEEFTSTVGYSVLRIDNTDGQADSAFERGDYALGNLLYYPVENVMMGAELQWGHRENARDGFSSDDVRVQFSFRYNFSYGLGIGGN